MFTESNGIQLAKANAIFSTNANANWILCDLAN